MIYFINGEGKTSYALEKYYQQKHCMGEFVKAEMISDPEKARYKLRLEDTFHNTLVITDGVSAGYTGTGADGTHEILKDAGFHVEETFIRTHASFRIEK